MCQTIILCENKDAVINQCADCGGLFIWHDDLMLTFGQEDFLQFHKTIRSLPFDGNCYLFPDGEYRMILQTPNMDISFCFRRTEFEGLCRLIDEAIFLINMHALIRQN